MAKPIENEWREFCKACFAPHLQWTHPEQYIDLRRTFYGGVSAMLATMLSRLSVGDEVTEADLEMMRALQQELREFSESVKKGLA